LPINLNQVFTLAIQHELQPGEQLGELNAELTQSFKRCRALLTDCREKLAPAASDAEAPRDETDAPGA